MHELYELKEMLCKELEEYGQKGNLSSGTLDVVDKLAHTIKNLDKIIEKEEGGSYDYRDGSSMRGSSMRGSYNESYNSSYRRGRGPNARRDSMGRYADNEYSRGYSRGKEMISELRDLMEEAPDEHTRMEFEKFIKRVEKME